MVLVENDQTPDTALPCFPFGGRPHFANGLSLELEVSKAKYNAQRTAKARPFLQVEPCTLHPTHHPAPHPAPPIIPATWP